MGVPLILLDRHLIKRLEKNQNNVKYLRTSRFILNKYLTDSTLVF